MELGAEFCDGTVEVGVGRLFMGEACCGHELAGEQSGDSREQCNAGEKQCDRDHAPDAGDGDLIAVAHGSGGDDGPPCCIAQAGDGCAWAFRSAWRMSTDPVITVVAASERKPANQRWALFRHEMRMVMDDPGVLVFLLLMPLLMMAVMKPLFALSLQADGFASASGAEQAVPGMAAMFATFSASFASFGFFREHGWGTWDRLRASSATTSDIMIGKLGPVLFISIAQLIGLFAIGVLLLDVAIAGSVTALVLIIIAFSLSMLAFGMAITAVSRTSLQLNMFANLGGIVFAGVGGALVPVTVLPDWVQSIARFIPTFWAMDGFLGVILGGHGVADVIRPTLVLLAFAAAFAAVAAVKFRFEETRIYYG